MKCQQFFVFFRGFFFRMFNLYHWLQVARFVNIYIDISDDLHLEGLPLTQIPKVIQIPQVIQAKTFVIPLVKGHLISL